MSPRDSALPDEAPPPAPDARPAPPPIPSYLRDTYTWAYLSAVGTRVFDRQAVVNAILWGNAGRLIGAVTEELEPGWHVLQPACVYGTFSADVARALGPRGRLDVTDIAPIQVALTRRKLAGVPQASVEVRDATEACRGPYDAVTCFFLLHEVPEDYKRRIVDALLGSVRRGGKVVFVDYHRPAPLHPLRPVMAGVFAALEPFAGTLWDREIASYASHADGFAWSKRTFFGGLYQKVVARKL
ncbi:rhodoquinone biosynthesis methyltransferase RquA [Novispirillum sp. DQ9]|uniref:rhodoquinone biosynthesis methyltransferase RquA n=1 Tax=Novispirillum sp. DQ9 TaxID=3398612 RepID=UPI003C7BA463